MSRKTSTVDKPNEPADAAASALGERVGIDGLRFVRHYRVSVARVWDAVTTAEGVAVWLGTPGALELVVGGAFEIAFSDEDRMDGRIVELEPQRRLVIRWHETSNGASAHYATESDDTSVVTFDFLADENGETTLIFTHRSIRGGEKMIGFGAGWHTHLEALGALLTGVAGVDRDARYAALRPLYEAALSS